MHINYLAVLVCGIAAMFLGYLWYGPLFGKKWMEIVKMDPHDLEAQKRMRATAGPLYFVQFVLALFQIWVLAMYFNGYSSITPVSHALWIWGGFVMPTIAGASMWNNDSAKTAWSRFLLQSGYQLVSLVVFALILGNWK